MPNRAATRSNCFSQTLGFNYVKSTGSREKPALETIEYPFPSKPRIEQFDQIRVIFHRPPARSDHSARIAIDRFILLP
jgi:hypothetical protein